MKSTVSHFASGQQAPTPTTSNRTAPIKNPPPLSLGDSNTSVGGFNGSSGSPRHPRSSGPTVQSTRQPRFSSPTTAPIVLSRSTPTAWNRSSLQAINQKYPVSTYLPSPPEPSLASIGGELPLLAPASPWHVIPLTLVCDLLKAGVPLKLLRNFIMRLIRIVFQQDTQLLLNRGLAFRVPQLRTNQKQVGGLRKIKGLPNYGQTCFMNSVLQAMASLHPFMVYLERIIEVRNELSLDASSRTINFSGQLLDILNTINGRTLSKSPVADPRSLLKLIGEHNPQFRSRHMEQQDAQELLQTLMDIVITDAQLDCTSSSDQYLRFLDHWDDSSYDETLTAAMAGDEFSLDWSPTSSLDLDEAARGGLISLPDLVHRIEAEHRESVGHEDDNSKDNQMREEKKQEDFEISAGSLTPGEEGVIYRSQKPSNDHTIGAQKADSQKLTASMQIMKSTMSSITPSPLSGWIGSALRCCNCNYIRAIRNAPFLNIPLVPTSVLKYHANVHGHRANLASPNRSPVPSCTLDQCLFDFTSVERVHDVECRSCTILKELEQLEDEALLLRGAIDSMEKRILKKGGDPSDQVKCLREDLSRIDLRMIKLKLVDPDDEDLCLNDSPLDEDGLIMSGGEEPSKEKESLERCDAMKCLTLTRCPSILCCHIQRRYSDPITGRMEKCVQFVEFPQILDLSPYCAYSPRTNTSWAAGSLKEGEGEQPGNGTRLPYRLQGIIEHRGNAHGGHYVCYRRDHSGDWFRISDANISPIPWRQVRTCQAYMLFYEAV